MKIAVLASGNLGFICIRQLFQAGHSIDVIFTDSRSTEIQAFALEKKIPVFNSNPRNGKGIAYLNSLKIQIDIILSVNYLFIIDPDVIHYPRVAAVNIHGSLLPKYRGRTPHVWAIINNETETGITAHLISKECDAGPIIDQLHVPIEIHDTGGSILDKYLNLYPSFVETVLKKFYLGNVESKPQNHSKATFFGKRTPESGAIQWSWQRERIYNWIRAQALPYPGAFCFNNGKRITIDKIEFSDLGFNFEQPNGLILVGGEQPVIKTPNGTIRILETRENHQYIIGEILI
jgi:methionyl-tRNA formyltransferase